MNEGATIAGHRLTGRTRTGELGTWHDAISPAGAPSGVLRFDPHLIGGARARERLITAVKADLQLLRQGGPPVLLPVADLVTARGEVWLITIRRAMPTLADLLGGTVPGAGIDAAGAASILRETAQALLTLHAAGLTHGAVHPGTVVIGDDGSVLLAERGLLAALRDASTHRNANEFGTGSTAESTAASTAADTAAWAALARGLAARFAQDSAHGRPAQGMAAALLDRAAAVALAQGLGAARETLLAGRDMLPPGSTTLAGTVHLWFSGGAPASPTPASPPAADMSPVTPAAGEAVTLLDLSGAHDIAPADPAAPAGRTAQPDHDVMMRFGPGVPTETTAEQIWRSGRTSTVHTQVIGDAPRRRKRRTTVWAGPLLLAMLIAAVILWLRMSPLGPDLAVLKVDVKPPKKTVRCGGRADFVGVVTTNGGRGTIRYEWLRSDGQKIEQEQSVGSGTTSLDFPLHWTVKGSGSFRGTATLRVLSPSATGKLLQDKASFSYKC
ncbi:protein kinase family protein [Sphaerimonospora thailandensis]|uniref:Uncharacterized protein n=1 Tax=Sphaerimonospora thailandensis TaxID=795644 RepID=A0A8J3VZ56_9ACTN|nr:hypothetical protein [Sphaerimonospora thailandensis]GIH69725.1 hypothetical protein Mth01_19780 [Sphaerimonospora thailandensis]